MDFISLIRAPRGIRVATLALLAVSCGTNSSRSGTGGSSMGGTLGTGGSSMGGTGTGDKAGASGGSGSGGAISTATTVPVISGLTITPNPNNTLSCFVAWTTDVAATSEVQFGAGQYQFHIVDSTPATNHRVLVIGMHASTKYLVKAVSTDAVGSASAEGTFTSGALPAGLPTGTITTSDTSGSQAGWTAVNIMPAGTNGGAVFTGTEPGIVVMYDMTGVPVWYFVNGTTIDQRGDISLRVLANHDLILGPTSGEPAKEIDLAGDVIWAGPAQPPTGASSSNPATAPMSHYAGKLDNGDYVLFRDLTNANGIGGALVQELTPDNTVVWQWNLFDHVTPPAGAASDWCHPNSVTVDDQNGVFYLNCRYQGLIKASRSGNGEIIWTLGGQGGGDFTFSPATAAFSDCHDPEIHDDDGTFLFYNNGGDSPTPPPGVTTRVLELKLDLTTMTAEQVFEFPRSFNVADTWYTTQWYTPYWGDADRLANGNVLVTAGFRSTTASTHVFEFRPSDGAVVWQMTLPAGVGSFQAERLSPPPLVEPL